MNSYNKSNINKRSLPIQIQQPSPINKRENEKLYSLQEGIISNFLPMLIESHC